MEICEEHIKPIVFSSKYCPLCEAEEELKEAEEKIQELEIALEEEENK